jgi:VanZ family protein
VPRYRGAWLAFGWLLIALVGAGSLWPSTVTPSIGLSDKLMHFGAYFALAFVFAGATARRHRGRLVLWLLAYGAAVELAQYQLTETRTAEWLDMAANTGGVLAGLAAAAVIPGGWCRRLELAFGVGGGSR